MEERVRPTLARRLLIRYALTVVAVLAALAFVLDRAIGAAFLGDLTVSLMAQARAVRAALPEAAGDRQPAAVALGRETGVRITVIRTDGVVVADSARDPAGIENHAGRPEVRAALEGRVGVASRTSETVGEPYRYVALPPRDGLIVRVALPLSIVTDRLTTVRGIVVGGAAAAALIGVGAVWLVGRSLTRPLRDMTTRVSRMAGGDLAMRLPPDGTAELDVLGSTLNRMADDLERRIDEIGRDRRTREAVLAAMEEGIALVGADDRVDYANPAAARLLGGVPDTLRGLTPAAVRTLVEETRADGRARDREVETGLPPRILRVSTVALREPGEVLVVLRDVSAARRIEAMRRDFVADASHELKTPAAAIQAAAETVERAVADDPVSAARFAVQLRRDAIRLSRIVSDLLDLSRLESERPPLEPVRLDDVVGEEVERIRTTGDGVRIESSVRPVTVRGARSDLALLLRNLLDNAVRYSPGGGGVQVRLSERDGRAILEVEDSGIGIPRRDLPRIFERFYRVDRARSRETGGTGLGLSIARHVVELHGGRIEAESELGQGSTFRVTLPAASPN
ncbi:MAG TPA: ATP-binding protein [Actinomycetota bacterium]|nr:ATP-binding protein [Actinomycetota bacterium]